MLGFQRVERVKEGEEGPDYKAQEQGVGSVAGED